MFPVRFATPVSEECVVYSGGHIGKLAFLGVVVFPVTEQCLTLDLFFFLQVECNFQQI